MKFSIQSNELQRALTIAGGVIPTKSTLPILENFLFELTKDTLTITATDLDTSVSVAVSVKNGTAGKAIVPARKFIETVRSLANAELNVSTEGDGNKIIMKTENGEYRLSCEASENYPTVSSFKPTEEIKVGGETLKRLITKTSFAVSADELRPAMMGVLLQMKKNEIRAVATDGHRLVRLVNSSFSSKTEREVIVPARALSLALKSFENADATISFSDTHIMFTIGTITLISRMIEEKYPNYESVIPIDNDKKLVVDREQLIDAVRRTALYASSTTHQVRLTLKKGSMAVSAEDIDFGSEAKETLTCEYSAESMEIGFNAMYIVDILSHIDTNDVLIMLSTSTRACIVKPTEQHTAENLLMLVMPVRLNS